MTKHQEKLNKLIEVCSECHQASCWYGEFMCDEAKDAFTVFIPIAQLKRLALEDESYWSDEKLLDVCGTKNPISRFLSEYIPKAEVEEYGCARCLIMLGLGNGKETKKEG